MPTKRTPKRRNGKMRITREVLDAYARVHKLYDKLETVDDLIDSDEYNEVGNHLHNLLDRTPWQTPIDQTFGYATNTAPTWMTRDDSIADFMAATVIRDQLDAALKERG